MVEPKVDLTDAGENLLKGCIGEDNEHGNMTWKNAGAIVLYLTNYQRKPNIE